MALFAKTSILAGGEQLSNFNPAPEAASVKWKQRR
jgi:hypothetical protein